MGKVVLSILVIALIVNCSCGKKNSQDVTSKTDVTQVTDEERMKWWEEARFGMFIHWGIYSVPAGFYKGEAQTNSAEWIMNKGKQAYLDTAIRLSDHFLDRLPEDGIPYWDFDDPKIPNAPKDASAAAIAACGMLEISTLVKDVELKEKYINAAQNFVKILSSKQYFSGDTNQALILHSTGHHPRNSEIDVPIIYADYYYMEALMRLKKMEANINSIAQK